MYCIFGVLDFDYVDVVVLFEEIRLVVDEGWWEGVIKFEIYMMIQCVMEFHDDDVVGIMMLWIDMIMIQVDVLLEIVL